MYDWCTTVQCACLYNAPLPVGANRARRSTSPQHSWRELCCWAKVGLEILKCLGLGNEIAGVEKGVAHAQPPVSMLKKFVVEGKRCEI